MRKQKRFDTLMPNKPVTEMFPGETGYTVPWEVWKAPDSDLLYLVADAIVVSRPYGTVQMRVRRDLDGGYRVAFGPGQRAEITPGTPQPARGQIWVEEEAWEQESEGIR